MLRIATWNINSVRLRIDQVARFVAESGTDVLCLQEIKCLEDQFPRGAFEAMGMPYLKIGGQKGWHGQRCDSNVHRDGQLPPLIA